jgi:hypothetical protein
MRHRCVAVYVVSAIIMIATISQSQHSNVIHVQKHQCVQSKHVQFHFLIHQFVLVLLVRLTTFQAEVRVSIVLLVVTVDNHRRQRVLTVRLVVLHHTHNQVYVWIVLLVAIKVWWHRLHALIVNAAPTQM